MSTASVEPIERASDGRQPSATRSIFWVVLALWVASNLFVTMVARMATWEGIDSYYSSADLCRWDCGIFGQVLTLGYQKGSALWLFHPAHPLLAYPLYYWLHLPLKTSLVLASKIALFFAIYGFILMLSDRIDSGMDRWMAGSLVAFNPYILYGHAGYSESLYFAALTFAFYFAARQRWITSGALGGFASLTRMVGVVFTASYAVILAERRGWRRLEWRKLAGLALCPMGTLLYMLYQYHRAGDGLAQIHSHVSFVGSQFSNPLTALWSPLHHHHWPRVWAIMVIAAFMASAWLFKLRKPEMGIYLVLSILVALLGGSLGGDLYGMARYIWWQPPFLYAIYVGLRRRPWLWPIYLVFASGVASFLIVEWFTGHNFVV
jgi:Gpi18-like mannosyltransferase